MTDKAAQHRRIIDAAIAFVYDGCANALMELEDAVVDLIGCDVADGSGVKRPDFDRVRLRMIGDDFEDLRS